MKNWYLLVAKEKRTYLTVLFVGWQLVATLPFRIQNSTDSLLDLSSTTFTNDMVTLRHHPNLLAYSYKRVCTPASAVILNLAARTIRKQMTMSTLLQLETLRFPNYYYIGMNWNGTAKRPWHSPTQTSSGFVSASVWRPAVAVAVVVVWVEREAAEARYGSLMRYVSERNSPFRTASTDHEYPTTDNVRPNRITLRIHFIRKEIKVLTSAVIGMNLVVKIGTSYFFIWLNNC